MGLVSFDSDYSGGGGASLLFFLRLVGSPVLDIRLYGSVRGLGTGKDFVFPRLIVGFGDLFGSLIRF